MTSKEKRIKEREQDAREIESSKNRMAEETGVSRANPKFEMAWRMAWEEGHSVGIGEVEDCFRELAQLIK